MKAAFRKWKRGREFLRVMRDVAIHGPSSKSVEVPDLLSITGPKRPHGDYGRMLFDGMCRRSTSGQPFGIWRTAQGIPDVSFPGFGQLVVTQRGRDRLDALGLENIRFVEVVPERLVDLDWTDWDFTAERLPEYGTEGEPENFIEDRPHRADLVAKIEPLWAMGSIEHDLGDTASDPDPYAEVNAIRSMLAARSGMVVWGTRRSGFSRLIVGSEARAALEREFGDEIAFRTVTVRVPIERGE